MEITPNLKNSQMVPVLHCSSRILLVDDRPDPRKKQAALPPEIDKFCGKSDFIFCKFCRRGEKKGKPIQFGILYIIRLWLFEERTFKSWRMIKTPQCHTNLSITIYSLTLLINFWINWFTRLFVPLRIFSFAPHVRDTPQVCWKLLKPTCEFEAGLVHWIKYHPHGLLPLAARSVYPSYSGKSWGRGGIIFFVQTRGRGDG